MQLTLIVGQNPNQTNIFGYSEARPAFGALTPRKVVGDNDTLITKFDVGSNGDVVIMAKSPILGATPLLTSEAGISVQMTFAVDVYTGNNAEFAASVKAHNNGTFNILVDTEATIAVNAKATTNPKDITKMTKAELIDHATKNKITINTTGTKAEILAEIQGA